MNFVKSLAKQLGPNGIAVNGVARGPIWAPLKISGGAARDRFTLAKTIRWVALDNPRNLRQLRSSGR